MLNLKSEWEQEQEGDHETCTNLKKAPLREGPNEQVHTDMNEC